MDNQIILVVDDDPNICKLLRLYLEKEMFVVETCNDGAKAISVFKKVQPSLVLLDIMLPSLNGWQVCKEIRSQSNVPIVMLTAKDETIDKVLGLELGADDYVVKPFDTKELVARIRAVLRRLNTKEVGTKIVTVTVDNIVINISNYELEVDGVTIDAPPKEIELIFYLATNANKVFTRDQLLKEVWGYNYCGDSRTIDVHIKRLREKLDGKSDKWELKTVWGVGYKFSVID